MMAQGGLLAAFRLDGTGRLLAVPPERALQEAMAPGECLWLHWDKGHPATRHWLEQQSGLPEFECELLLARGTRPRLVEQHEQHLLLFSRTPARVTLPGEENELYSLRALLDDRLLLTFAHAGVWAADMLEKLPLISGPVHGLPSLLILLLHDGVQQIDDMVEGFAEQVDAGEEALVQDSRSHTDQQQMMQLRRDTANLRRYLLPMRDLFAALQHVRLEGAGRGSKARLAELSNSLVRCLEELDLCRERLNLILDTERQRREERSGRIIYLLTLVTAFFLPLSFITGLLGINLGGIPGGAHPAGFWLACLALVMLGLVELLLLRLLRWL